MRRRATFLIGVAIVLGSLLTIDAPAASKRIKPTAHAGAVKVKIGKKTSGYHKATAEQPVEFRVKGPTKVRLLSRCLFTTPPKDRITYRIHVEIDGVALPTAVENATVSSDARLADGKPIGTLERTILRIPDGDHKVRLFPEGEDPEVAVRLFLGTGKKSKTTWVSFAPEDHAGSIRLHAGDTEYAYYRFNEEQPVQVTIVGPLRLKITTRLDFGSANGYTQSYIVHAMLDGELWKSFPLQSRASHTSTYPDFPDITPGRGQIIELEVPEGSHQIEIHLNGTTAAGAALRIRVPKQELKIG
jgi:hypothetical protein